MSSVAVLALSSWAGESPRGARRTQDAADRLCPGRSGNAPLVDDDLTGVARGSETLLDVLGRFTTHGFVASFTPVDGGAEGRLRCETCRAEFAANEPVVYELRRLEGASDPDDMLAVVALECPRCATRGSLVLNYGPTAMPEDAAALTNLREPDGDAH